MAFDDQQTPVLTGSQHWCVLWHGFRVQGGREGNERLPVPRFTCASDGTDISKAGTTYLLEAASAVFFLSGCVGLARAEVLQEVSVPLGLPFEKSAKALRCLFLEMNSTFWYVCSHL